MDNGYIKLWRKAKENGIMKDHLAWTLFSWILMSVNRTTGKYTTGRFILAEALGTKPNTVYKALVRLEKKYKVVTRNSNNKSTTISVLNWTKYQESSELVTPPSNNKVTTKSQQSNTKQEIENIEIENNNTNVLLEKSQFGSQDVNEVLNYFKQTMKLPMLDGSVQQNRRYAHLALKKYEGLAQVKLLIDATSRHKFWATKVTSIQKLYYKGVEIISSGRGEVRAIDASKVVRSQDRQQGVYLDGGGIRGDQAGIAK